MLQIKAQQAEKLAAQGELLKIKKAQEQAQLAQAHEAGVAKREESEERERLQHAEMFAAFLQSSDFQALQNEASLPVEIGCQAGNDKDFDKPFPDAGAEPGTMLVEMYNCQPTSTETFDGIASGAQDRQARTKRVRKPSAKSLAMDSSKNVNAMRKR